MVEHYSTTERSVRGHGRVLRIANPRSRGQALRARLWHSATHLEFRIQPLTSVSIAEPRLDFSTPAFAESRSVIQVMEQF